MQKVINKGFTLIELLVVIAIIGILAAIVLVSLGTARQSGADAGAKGDFDSIRTQAEVSAANNGNSYQNLFTDSTILSALKGAASNEGVTAANVVNNAAGDATHVVINTSAGAWAAQTPLKVGPTSGAGFWCIDSTGAATSTPSNTLSNNTDYVCGP